MILSIIKNAIVKKLLNYNLEKKFTLWFSHIQDIFYSSSAICM